MKQFSLEEFKKNPNRKVVTRDGHSVRIICTDSKGNYPIIALVDYYEVEELFFYNQYGKCLVEYESKVDLFFDSEKKDGYINIYRSVNGRAGFIFDTKEEAEKDCNYGKNEAFIKTVKISWEE